MEAASGPKVCHMTSKEGKVALHPFPGPPLPPSHPHASPDTAKMSWWHVSPVSPENLWLLVKNQLRAGADQRCFISGVLLLPFLSHWKMEWFFFFLVSFFLIYFLNHLKKQHSFTFTYVYSYIYIWSIQQFWMCKIRGVVTNLVELSALYDITNFWFPELYVLSHTAKANWKKNNFIVQFWRSSLIRQRHRLL